MCGDLTGDGEVDVADVITALQISVDLVTPTETQSQLGDLNRDGVVDIADVITALQIVAQLATVEQYGTALGAPVIDLLESSDTGSDDSDNVTSETTPTLEVAADPGTGLRVFVDGQLFGEATTTASGVEQFTTAPLADGTHVFTAEGTDTEGTITTSDPLEVVVDSTPPDLTLTAPTEGGVVGPGSRLLGAMDGTGSQPASLVYHFGARADIAVAVGADTGAFSQVLDMAGLTNGAESLTVTATDLAGNQTTPTINVVVDLTVPFSIASHTPLNGGNEVGVTVRPQVVFSSPIDPTSLNSTNFFASAAGETLAATIVPANDGQFAWLFFASPLPSSAVVEVTVDGSTITPLGGGSPLDADGDGASGGVLTFSFTTVSIVPLVGTSLSGIVSDPGPDGLPMTADDFDPGPDGIAGTSDDIVLLPIEGVEVHLIGLEAAQVITGADGRFTLDPVPAGNVKLVLNGMTAVTPDGADYYFPEMVMDVNVQPGVDNFAMSGMEEVFLPRIPTAILQTVTSADGMTIVADEVAAPDLTPEEQAFLTIDIRPNSLIGEDGRALTSAQIGISTVPPELVRDMLPEGVLQHTFDITVQALGVSNFSDPAPMTFPNVLRAPPGSQLNFLSFDHTTGRLVIEGTATVSADGLSVTTDPDTGITHPGWHGLTPPGTENSPPCDPTAVHDIMVAPVPVTSGLVDHFTKDDSGNWTYSFGNAAQLLDPSKDPCHPENIKATPLVVMITVDGPAGEFLTGLSSQTFELQPGQQKNIQFDVNNLIPGVKDVDKDRLYGVRVIIKGWKQGEPGTLLPPLDNKKVYVYRFFDVADDDHDDGIIEFADTLNDGLANVQRPREFEQHMHSAPPPTLTVASNTNSPTCRATSLCSTPGPRGRA